MYHQFLSSWICLKLVYTPRLLFQQGKWWWTSKFGVATIFRQAHMHKLLARPSICSQVCRLNRYSNMDMSPTSTDWLIHIHADRVRNCHGFATLLFGERKRHWSYMYIIIYNNNILIYIYVAKPKKIELYLTVISVGMWFSTFFGGLPHHI
jgi:hypothetical protein